MKIENIYGKRPSGLSSEIFETILETDIIKVERIVSKGHKTPEGFWYDQSTNEWVILLQGSATISFEKKDRTVTLKPGDYLNIPKHCKHRVASTSENPETVWLAIHY